MAYFRICTSSAFFTRPPDPRRFRTGRRGDFVVMHFDLEAHLLEGIAHRGAHVLVSVDRRNREVAALEARTMSLVAFREYGVAVPRALHRIDRVRRLVDRAVPAHAVEDEEFVLGSEQRAVGDARGLEVCLGALAERARITLIALHGRRFDDVAADVDRGRFEERVDDGRSVGSSARIMSDSLMPFQPRWTSRRTSCRRETGLLDEVRGDRYVLFFAAVSVKRSRRT
jgi:hypothetical protein